MRRSFQDRASAYPIVRQVAQSAMIPASPPIATSHEPSASPDQALIAAALAAALPLLPAGAVRRTRASASSRPSRPRRPAIFAPGRDAARACTREVQGFLTGPPVGFIPSSAASTPAAASRSAPATSASLATRRRGSRAASTPSATTSSSTSPSTRRDMCTAVWTHVSRRDGGTRHVWGITASARDQGRGPREFPLQRDFCGRRSPRAGARAFCSPVDPCYCQDFRERSRPGFRSVSIEETYTPATAPGLGTNPNVFHSILFGGLDWRPAPGMRAPADSTKCGTTTWPVSITRRASTDWIPKSFSTFPSSARRGSCHCAAACRPHSTAMCPTS